MPEYYLLESEPSVLKFRLLVYIRSLVQWLAKIDIITFPRFVDSVTDYFIDEECFRFFWFLVLSSFLSPDSHFYCSTSFGLTNLCILISLLEGTSGLSSSYVCGRLSSNYSSTDLSIGIIVTRGCDTCFSNK